MRRLARLISRFEVLIEDRLDLASGIEGHAPLGRSRRRASEVAKPQVAVGVGRDRHAACGVESCREILEVAGVTISRQVSGPVKSCAAALVKRIRYELLGS